MSTEQAETYDHASQPVHHGRLRINGIRMHYITAGSGPALVLLHGTPKNSFYWYRLFPLLTEHFTLVAPDLRGFGYTDKPPATEGYDCGENADDVAELMSQLGHERFFVHGEDRGQEYAYAVAAKYRNRVLKLSFCEMLLSGFGLEESSFWTPDNVSAQFRQQGVWCWHLPFFWMPHVPEMLIQGREREFWEMFIKQECYNPTSIEPKALDHWIECVKQPGGLRGILETYRSAFKNAEINKELAKKKLTIPVMTIGAPEFFGPKVKECALIFAQKVERSELFEECGHSLALEKAGRLAKFLKEFMLES
ncbi:hypothetical protein BAUCODRAFT_124609 [Baudoinia panamericana UAMH 10762]|uniref:AB hydrolase-1 domain-containing protein n=1 Tax=Baudoinia panamericana (strain UAMH 10762) TaxID=717646 RepID=M2LI47_BAUPA|nr:uncharacterized protein BAUCODRAFT_124609 [Baudoinia panamericana UAMH 10762]EMC93857.1 hypothetical protein BAUCODRAFT_124609 [Baudoinia panamericana UAMH 10762]